MLRYIRNDIPGASKSKEANAMTKHGIDLTDTKMKNFQPVFLFTEGGGENITQIIGDGNYQQGFDSAEHAKKT